LQPRSRRRPVPRARRLHRCRVRRRRYGGQCGSDV